LIQGTRANMATPHTLLVHIVLVNILV